MHAAISCYLSLISGTAGERHELVFVLKIEP